ncbi:histidine kinase [Pseudomonas sp. R2.Fl]|nr:histidine kinase [Pseudomonas sp. R2.Fl]
MAVAESVTNRPSAEPPFWLPLLAGLPIGLCLVVMALPALGHGHATAYRTLYLLAFLAWLPPLVALQRGLWRRRLPIALTAGVLLLATYAMSVFNNLLGDLMALSAGWTRTDEFRFAALFNGLESCWLALIAFCAMHAVIAYYVELKHEKQQREQAHLLARDAELRALRYQLHPHFLFNTLNAISTLVTEERGHDARRMINQLAEFLRATLAGDSRHEVSVAEEIALTEAYLEIEKARLGERLQVVWRIEAELLHAAMPYLLLQPLVENAIRHGIAPRATAGRLDIHFSRRGDRLLLRLDNDVAAPLPEASARDGAVGQRNVAERLARLYPADHHFQAGPCADAGGYRVSLDLPFRVSVIPRASTREAA